MVPGLISLASTGHSERLDKQLNLKADGIGKTCSTASAARLINRFAATQRNSSVAPRLAVLELHGELQPPTRQAETRRAESVSHVN